MELTQAVADFFVCLVRFGVGLMWWATVEVINEIMSIMGFLAMLIGFVLPDMNFDPPQLKAQWLGWINWIFPLGFLAQLYTYALAAGAIYRVLKWAAKRARTPVQPRLPGL